MPDFGCGEVTKHVAQPSQFKNVHLVDQGFVLSVHHDLHVPGGEEGGKGCAACTLLPRHPSRRRIARPQRSGRCERPQRAAIE